MKKHCTRCGKVSEFYKLTNGKYRAECKDCYNQRNLEYQKTYKRKPQKKTMQDRFLGY